MARLFHRHPRRHRSHAGDRRALQLLADQLNYQYPVEYEGGETPMQKLERLTWEGAAWRYPDGVPDNSQARSATNSS